MAEFKLEGWEELSRQLDRIDDQLTSRTKLEALQAGGAVIASRARQLCPVGEPAHNRKAKPLRDTIAVEIRDYGERGLAVIGPAGQAGAHGHNVEHGHEIVTRDGKPTGKRARPKKFLRPAFDETKQQQTDAMQSVVDRKLREIGG